MGLILSGKLYSRTSKPYSMKDRETGESISGTSHRARVGVGRGEFIDVKLTDETVSLVPPTHEIPEDGQDVSWEVGFAFGKIVLVGPAASGSRALRPAASS